VLPLPPVETAGAVALASAALVAAVGWFGVRPLLLARIGPRSSPAAGGLAAATGALLCTVAALVWVANPYAAALLLPAAHLWLFAAAPQTRLRGWPGWLALVVGLLPVLVVVVHYLRSLRLDPLELAWAGTLAAASGELSLLFALVVSALAACLAALIRVLRTRRHDEAGAPPEPLRTRGPASYAGPGSLGGTESALRR